jgi:hypothetical protein
MPCQQAGWTIALDGVTLREDGIVGASPDGDNSPLDEALAQLVS